GEWPVAVVAAAISRAVDAQPVLGDGGLIAVEQETDFAAWAERRDQHRRRNRTDERRQRDSQHFYRSVERTPGDSKGPAAVADLVGLLAHRLLKWGGSIVSEDVPVGPTGKVEPRACGQEVEARLGDRRATFACEALFKDRGHAMQITHVGRRVFALSVAEFRGAPIAGLLLLGDLFAKQLADEVLEPVTVGVGAGQLAGDLGAEYRSRHDAKIMLDRREVEAREMIELHSRRIGKNGLEIGRFVATVHAEANELLVAGAVADLHHAKPVARGDETHRLGVDGDRSRSEYARGQIFFVEMYCHWRGHRRIGDRGKEAAGDRCWRRLACAPDD